MALSTCCLLLDSKSSASCSLLFAFFSFFSLFWMDAGGKSTFNVAALVRVAPSLTCPPPRLTSGLQLGAQLPLETLPGVSLPVQLHLQLLPLHLVLLVLTPGALHRHLQEPLEESLVQP